MPALSPLSRALCALAAVAVTGSCALAAGAPPKIPEAASYGSRLDAPLFYQLLIGELEVRNGQPGTAYAVVLDAAKRTGDEALFRRAADIALEARAGEQALAAARAWREAVPKSLEAHRYLVQILIALGRISETVEPLQSLIAQVPESGRPALIASLPRFFERSNDRKLAPGILEQVLKTHLTAPATRVASNIALGRAWLGADDTARALANAQRAQALDPAAEGAALLALEMMSAVDGAETLVRRFLETKPLSTSIRVLYTRVLTTGQRYADAISQLEIVTRDAPELGPPWLSLGALHVELRHPREAEAALQKYLQVAEGSAAPAASGDEEEVLVISPAEGLTQAWLLLAQAAEQRGDYAAGEKWLEKIDNTQRALEVQTRRASLLARQGRIDDARETVRRLPERTPADARAKLLAEAQVLRDVKRWSDANDVLAQANKQFSDDPDLLYEQSMMSEKLNRMDEMERLLRRVIELKPDFHHAYNALGYSLAERNQRLPEAKALIQKALQLMPGEPFVTDSLGWVEFRMGNREEALRLLRRAYAARPDTEIGAHLGEVLWVAGQRDEARRILREARSRDAGNDVLSEVLARLKVDL
jgi:tetratricopeptide (TPR) repeat protein